MSLLSKVVLWGRFKENIYKSSGRGLIIMVHVELYVWSYCPYCQRAEGLFEEKGVSFERHVMDDDEAGLKKLREETGHKTVPQIFIDGDFIGGCDDLFDLEDRGELDPMLGIENEDFEFDEDEEED